MLSFQYHNLHFPNSNYRVVCIDNNKKFKIKTSFRCWISVKSFVIDIRLVIVVKWCIELNRGQTFSLHTKLCQILNLWYCLSSVWFSGHVIIRIYNVQFDIYNRKQSKRHLYRINTNLPKKKKKKNIWWHSDVRCLSDDIIPSVFFSTRKTKSRNKT